MSHSIDRLMSWLADAGVEASLSGPSDTLIEGLTFDSRQAGMGKAFAALPGTKVDGHDFIPKAVDQGCSLIIAQSDPKALPQDVAWLKVPNSAQALALVASKFYGELPNQLQAVTGTNGKTSVAHFVCLIMGEDKAVSIGTLGMMPQGLFDMPPLTSPDQIALAQGLAAAARQGRTTAIIEASSHGLDQFRLEGLKFQAAGFTNLSRDHLDYHDSMDAYWQAKRRLFTDLLVEGGKAVIDTRLQQARELESLGVPLFKLGALDDASVDLGFAAEPRANGLHFRYRLDDEVFALDLPLFGTFQAENIAMALGLAHLAGFTDLGAKLSAIPKEILGVPGRMMPAAQHPLAPFGQVLVDYAHTPDALETVLRAARPHCSGKLIVVFGAGGDRDPGKRPLMGQAARYCADFSIITDDNPRTEDPAPIRQAILAACPGALEIADREQAIRAGLEAMSAEDMLIVAGKGHESGQIIGETKLPFDDSEVTQRLANDLWGSIS